MEKEDEEEDDEEGKTIVECKKLTDDEESEKTLTKDEVVKSDESPTEPRLSQETQISEIVIIPTAYRITSLSENSLNDDQDKDISLEKEEENEDSSSTKMTKDTEPLSQLSLNDSGVVVMASKSCQVSQNGDSPPQSQSSKDSDTSNEEYFTQNSTNQTSEEYHTTSQTEQTKSDIDSQDSQEVTNLAITFKVRKKLDLKLFYLYR